jgi:hypothetical protein
MTYTEQQRLQMIREAEDEKTIQQNGTTCSPRHVKRYCRNRMMELDWRISRLQRKKSIDNLPSTVYVPRLIV